MNLKNIIFVTLTCFFVNVKSITDEDLFNSLSGGKNYVTIEDLAPYFTDDHQGHVEVIMNYGRRTNESGDPITDRYHYLLFKDEFMSAMRDNKIPRCPVNVMVNAYDYLVTTFNSEVLRFPHLIKLYGKDTTQTRLKNYYEKLGDVPVLKLEGFKAAILDGIIDPPVIITDPPSKQFTDSR